MARKVRNKDRYTLHTDAELDLHGYRSEEARRALDEFLADAREFGWKRVRIIVGKGIHSENGEAVVPNMVKRHLVSAGLDYTYAKLHEGGEGALVVRL